MRKTFLIIMLFYVNVKTSYSQGYLVDSMTDWISQHPKIDSEYIQTLHRISYRLSEKDVNRSFLYYERVLRLSDSLNFTYGKALAQINLGLFHFNSGNFAASNNAYFKAIDFAKACGALRAEAVSYNNAGDNFKSLKDYDKARQYTEQALQLNLQLQADRGIAINYELLHQCDLFQQLYASSRINLEKGMPYAIRLKESYILSQYYCGFGKLEALENNMDSAKYYFTKAIDEALIQKDLRNQYLAYLAEAEYLKNLPTTIKISLLDSALQIARQTAYYEGISQAAEQLSNIYDQLNNKDSSLAYYRMYRAAFDSLFSENNQRNVIINEAEWMGRQKDIENKHLRDLSTLQKRQLIFRNALLIAVFILLVLTIAIAFFYNKSLESKKNRAEMHYKQQLAESQIQSLRAQMSPHFIFNSLNSIENFMMRSEKRKASDYLHKFALLMRNILESSRNELTPVSSDMEALKLYIDLEQMRFNHKFCYRQEIDPELIGGDYSVPSLLIQPFVENAIIHGLAHSDRHDLKLSINASLDGEYIRYVIRDNGIGRCKAGDYNKLNKLRHKSVGLKITEDRIYLYNKQQQANGYVKITDLYDENNDADGTQVDVKIKAT